MAVQLKNVDWALVPLECPWCPHEATDREAMVYHWVECHPREANRWRPSRKAPAGSTSGPPGALVDDILSTTWAPPRWVGLVLLLGALWVPETRWVVLRILRIAIQVLAWGFVLLAVVALLAGWAVVSLGPSLVDWLLSNAYALWAMI